MTPGRRPGSPEVVVVGLGPAGPDLLTAATVDAVAGAPAAFLRTGRHPAASAFPDVPTFDDVYESAATMDEVYGTIVDRLVAAAAEHGRVVYAVPGSPVVAERTVQLLIDDERVDTTVLPAMSFLDLAWVRLGVDPVAAGVRVVDGHRFAAEAAASTGALLIGQCDTVDVLSDIKLAVEDWPDEPIVVLQRLGAPDERRFEVSWADLDREVEPDHLTSLYVPRLGAPVAAELVRFDELVHALRAGCPWDREQTHASLQRYLLEETYELLEAIDGLEVAGDAGDGPTDAAVDALCEELGDVLFQVFFHATIAAEEGWFTLADVARGIHDKLHARHPHVFGDASFDSVDELTANWEAQKLEEKSRASVMDGIPSELPALLYAAKVTKKAATAGAPLAADLPAEWRDLDADATGTLLLALADSARRAGVDPEDALRRAARRFRDDFDAR